jgi:hypothetical protein
VPTYDDSEEEGPYRFSDVKLQNKLLGDKAKTNVRDDDDDIHVLG